MLVIKPYGRSVVSAANQAARKRQLLDKQGKLHDVDAIPTLEPKAWLAHWASVLDKIIRKPQQGKQPNQTQFDLREALGQAFWQRLRQHYLGNDADKYQNLWCAKVHPYGKQRPLATELKDGKTAEEQRREEANAAKGRWYAVFVGDTEPENLLAAQTQPQLEEITEKVYQHLCEKELHLGSAGKTRQRGKLANLAKSIEQNALKPSFKQQQWWSSADEDAYFEPQDVAAQIYQQAQKHCGEKAQQAQANGPNAKPSSCRLDLSMAAAILHDHWSKVFFEGEEILGVAAAKEKKAGLFALHEAIKAYYRSVLKESRKKDKLARLPKDKEELLNKIRQKQGNQDINQLIRLGKVLYYCQATDEKVPLDQSCFWGSDGQAAIKRDEAFVRVWRNALSQANRTLASWASLPTDELERDAFDARHFGQHIQSLLKDATARSQYDENLALLFGEHADLFNADDDKRRIATIKLAQQRGARLRNAAFHFKGLQKFIAELQGLAQVLQQSDVKEEDAAAASVRKLYQTALQQRHERLLATLEAAHAFHYGKKDQLSKILAEVKDAADSKLPLPRFNRVLERHARIAERDKDGQIKQPKYGPPALPEPTNRQEMEQQPARRCQYVLLKLLYQKAFPRYLEKHSERIAAWVKDALERTTKAAQSINATGGKDERELVTAKAAKLVSNWQGKNIYAFLAELSAMTASEMRVQRGYESNPEQARKQAEYIQDLLLDVMARAFREYLNASGFRWLLELDPQQPLPQTRCCARDALLSKPTPDPKSQDWQAMLYFLLHLVPVNEVSQLLHQLVKWHILAQPAQGSADIKLAQPLQEVLGLYLDMHDSQYTGENTRDAALPPATREMLQAFQNLYEGRHVFDKVFPDQGNPRDAERYLPQRGLREICRFGHVPLLRALCVKPISESEVSDCFQLEQVAPNAKHSKVAVAQRERERLHADWVKNKYEFEQWREYAAALQTVVRHRHLANRIYLVDYVNAHRIVLKVLARLADYAGLFERDLTFVVLAKLHEAGLKPQDFFNEKGYEKFEEGQIIRALEKVQQEHKQRRCQICQLFANHFENVKKIRNALAHFNMLHSENGVLNEPLNLTDWVNCTRELMAYDRKLKNAVSKSVMELLEREGFWLRWEMDANHQLCNATIVIKQVKHLGGKQFPLRHGGKERVSVYENLHSQGMAAMLAKAFGGEVKAAKYGDITQLNLAEVQWEAVKSGKNE